jgi:capsid portal protein
MFAQVLRDEESKMDVQVLEDKNEGNFMSLSQLARENIITAHRWTPALAGKSVAGTLGSNQQIRSELEIILNTVIKPAQKLMLTKVLNPIMCEASEWMETDWRDISLDIVSTMPISFLGDLDPNEILTLNEKRQTLGLEPLEGGDSEPENPQDDVSSPNAN